MPAISIWYTRVFSSKVFFKHICLNLNCCLWYVFVTHNSTQLQCLLAAVLYFSRHQNTITAALAQFSVWTSIRVQVCTTTWNHTYKVGCDVSWARNVCLCVGMCERVVMGAVCVGGGAGMWMSGVGKWPVVWLVCVVQCNLRGCKGLRNLELNLSWNHYYFL